VSGGSAPAALHAGDRGYQAWGSPQCGQRTDAVTGAWKADPQRHT
jgi:hypothetical protein